MFDTNERYKTSHSNSYLLRISNNVRRHYQRDDVLGRHNHPVSLEPFLQGQFFLSTKEVPSALAIRGSGNKTLCAQIDAALEVGIPLERSEDFKMAPEDREYFDVIDPVLRPWRRDKWKDADYENRSQYSNTTSSVTSYNEGVEIDFTEPYHEDRYYDVHPTHRGETIIKPKFNGDNFFSILSARAYLGHKFGERAHYPEIITWSGDGLRLTDKIPGRLLGKHWNGNDKGSEFAKIANHNVKVSLLWDKTHWGQLAKKLSEKGSIQLQALSMYCRSTESSDDEAPTQLETSVIRFAKLFRKRINHFLNGKHDPMWRNHEETDIFEDPSEDKSREQRSRRFCELLKTVDGMFVQRFLAFPEEVWNWFKFDIFVINSISALLGDEFYDGTIKKDYTLHRTGFEVLKGTRKAAKLFLHSNTIKQGAPAWPAKAEQGWLQYFHDLVKIAGKIKEGTDRAQLVSYLSQTRGCGTPPPTVVIKSKMKALITWSTLREQPFEGFERLVSLSVDAVIREIPDEAFTGLRTKAAVNASSAACYEATREEYGTIAGVKQIIARYNYGQQVPHYDLDTMKLEGYFSPDDVELGTYIFWSALHICISTDPDELSEAKLVVAVEPGKARTVTKARTALKIVLDVVNKICSWPLTKVESSESGMQASWHAWNLFKSIFRSDGVNPFFRTKNLDSDEIDGATMTHRVYKEIFSASTDYESATDSADHRVFKILGLAWMKRCGIPKALRGLVVRTCYSPRTIYFTASGPIKQIGQEVHDPDLLEAMLPDDNPKNIQVRKVRLVTGVLMGDPLTKVTLHLLNKSVRKYAESAHMDDFYARQIPLCENLTSEMKHLLQD